MEGDDDRRLDAAVSLGIITAEQARAIRDLVPRRAPAPQRAMPTGAAFLGYVVGAITVLVAMTWFLADRWEWLGPGGVLTVALLYVAVFWLVSRRLTQEGFRLAAAIATTLAVGMVPLVTLSLLELTQWLAEPSPAACRYPDFVFWPCRAEELLVELTTLGAALLVFRTTRVSLLVLPIAGIGLRFVFHAADVLWRQGLGALSAGWVWVIGASLLLAAAYEADRRTEDRAIGLWLHLVAAIAANAAVLLLVGQIENYRHLLIPLALLAFVFALRMARAAWTVVGLIWFVAYLGWLAGEVFEDSPFFPIVLAALGIGVIILTVWIQRNSARLVARFGGLQGQGKPVVPGGVALLLIPVAVALWQLPVAAEVDRAVRAEADARQEMYRRRALRMGNRAPTAAREAVPPPVGPTTPRETRRPSQP